MRPATGEGLIRSRGQPPARGRALLPGRARAAKSGHRPSGPKDEARMEAILAILLFILVLGGLNYYEYHRFD